MLPKSLTLKDSKETTMKHYRNTGVFSYVLAGLLIVGCSSEEEEKITMQASEFIENYFNLNFNAAYKNCTPESRKWISFHVSNLTEDDLQALRSSPEAARVVSTKCHIINDSVAQVDCMVRGVHLSGTIENGIPSFSKAKYGISLVKRKKKWWVKMEAPLQSAE